MRGKIVACASPSWIAMEWAISSEIVKRRVERKAQEMIISLICWGKELMC